MQIVCNDRPEVAGDFHSAQFAGVRGLLHLGLKCAQPFLRERLEAAGVSIVSIDFGLDGEAEVSSALCLSSTFRIVIPGRGLGDELAAFFLALAEVIFPRWCDKGVCGSFAWRIASDTMDVHLTPPPDEELSM